jgi:hypothetical protein
VAGVALLLAVAIAEPELAQQLLHTALAGRERRAVARARQLLLRMVGLARERRAAAPMAVVRARLLLLPAAAA